MISRPCVDYLATRQMSVHITCDLPYHLYTMSMCCYCDVSGTYITYSKYISSWMCIFVILSEYIVVVCYCFILVKHLICFLYNFTVRILKISEFFSEIFNELHVTYRILMLENSMNYFTEFEF